MLRIFSRFLAMLLLPLVAGVTSLPAAPGKANGEPRERIVMGWLESVIIEPWGVKLRAKLDTGAKTSSRSESADIAPFTRQHLLRLNNPTPDENVRLLREENADPEAWVRTIIFA